jgi:SAM-dependent methyltransferase
VPPADIDDGWDRYLARFHGERPGITDAVLSCARGADGRDAYDWLVDALPARGVVIDAACGSGPLATRLAGRWFGLDRTPAEVNRAAAVAPGRAVLADAAAVPARDGAADVVVCSMALMLFDDPGAALAEMARLLRSGGRLAALVPATAPLTIRDRARYLRLLTALRLRRLPFRHPGVLDDGTLLVRAGLTVVGGERRRFAYPITGPEAAHLWLRSLYLPGLEVHRWHAGLRVAERWVGSDIGLPLRRVVATRT